ncbi:MAG: hypothetical protein N3B18_05245 [Desulfobacterota bacterium]|nr:hypothetical protein [Thermodesulfobacteriota bacterium]
MSANGNNGSTAYFANGKHGYLRFEDDSYGDYVLSLIKKIVPHFFRHAHTAIEIGPGLGRFSCSLVKEFKTVVLIEPSKDFAQSLRDFFKNDNVTVHELTAEEFFSTYDVSDGSVIIGFHILHHLNKHQRQTLYRFIKEKRVQALFAEPNPYNPLIFLQVTFHPDMDWKEEIEYLRLTKKRLFHELNKSGFRNPFFTRICFLPPPLAHMLLKTPLKKALPYFEMFNKVLPFLVSYQLVHFTGYEPADRHSCPASVPIRKTPLS